LKVLYLTQDGLTDPLGQSQIIPYLSGLAKSGYSIVIVSCEKKAAMEKDRKTIENLLQLNRIAWHPVDYSNRIPVLSPILTLRRMWKASLKILKADKFSAIHSRSTPSSIVGLQLGRKFNLQLIYDMRGFWADERVEGNLWPQHKWLFRRLYRYTKKKEQTLLNESDHIISLTHAGKNIIENNADTRLKHPVTVIPCCADFSHFDPKKITEENKFQKKKELSISLSSKIIIYTGSIGTWYMLDEMMEFFNVYHGQFHDSIFLFVTKENHEYIKTAARKAGVSENNIRVTSAGRKDMPLLLSLADFSLYFIKPGFSKQASSPVKQGESLAMNIPVITNSGIGDSDLLIKENNFGWMVESFVKSSYEKAIRQMKDVDKATINIRENAFKHLSLEKGIETYLQVYRSCNQ
jgi:glycosyltransferase involved in cell wall biosynthesis